ncbi:Uncharacterised protein [Klebsiella pneumoniae]|uniref:Uncharacterized protein n=1 Tax=Klebsiella pneumoniae TaxID=573 RepID=A0A2X3HAT6_KLEPN|nr:Uncharacterised protein [Klebsiella pneumoniae]
MSAAESRAASSAWRMHWAGQLPVGGKVELHRAGDVIDAQVFPFGLAYRQLAAIKIENDRRMLPVPASNANR